MARPGQTIAVRATPRAGRNAVIAPDPPDAPLRVLITEAPEGGKANRAVRRLLARALGIAPSRLTLLRGESTRDKLFRVD
jgi:uncharacterized protein